MCLLKSLVMFWQGLVVLCEKRSYIGTFLNMSGCFSFCLVSYILGIFSKTEQYVLLLDKLSPDSVMASSRSEENVLNNFQTSSDLEEAMTESGESLTNSQKYCSVLEKIPSIYGTFLFDYVYCY